MSLIVLLLTAGALLAGAAVLRGLLSNRRNAVLSGSLSCPACGAEQPSPALFCPNCSQPMASAIPLVAPAARGARTRVLPVVLGALSALCLAGGGTLLYRHESRPAVTSYVPAISTAAPRQAAVILTPTAAPTPLPAAVATAPATAAIPTATAEPSPAALASTTATVTATTPASSTPGATTSPAANALEKWKTDPRAFVNHLQALLRAHNWDAIPDLLTSESFQFGLYRAEWYPLPQDEFMYWLGNEGALGWVSIDLNVPQKLRDNIKPQDGTQFLAYCTGLGFGKDEGVIELSREDGQLRWNGLIYVTALQRDY
jgi:hypothetical protein